MEIIINDAKTIAEIQKEFNALFPMLKVEFFKKPHAEFGSSAVGEMLGHELKVRDAASKKYEGNLRFTPSTKVSELESELANTFGLRAQVFRKAGSGWIETTMTDSWTLQERNNGERDLAAMN